MIQKDRPHIIYSEDGNFVKCLRCGAIGTAGEWAKSIESGLCHNDKNEE